jgi:hypothetical protein
LVEIIQALEECMIWLQSPVIGARKKIALLQLEPTARGKVADVMSALIHTYAA